MPHKMPSTNHKPSISKCIFHSQDFSPHSGDDLLFPKEQKNIAKSHLRSGHQKFHTQQQLLPHYCILVAYQARHFVNAPGYRHPQDYDNEVFCITPIIIPSRPFCEVTNCTTQVYICQI